MCSALEDMIHSTGMKHLTKYISSMHPIENDIPEFVELKDNIKTPILSGCNVEPTGGC